MTGAEPSHAPGAPWRLRTMAFKFAFAGLLVAAAFAATYTSSSGAFSSYDLENIAALGAAVNVVALLAALLLLRRKHLVNAVLSLIVLAGVGSAYIAHTDLWLTGNRAVLVLLCAMSLAGLFVAFRVIDELRWWGGAALSAAALLGFWMIAGEHLLADRSPVPGNVSNIRHVSFQRTPNLYFVSFDSIAPRALLRKYLGVETTRLVDLFEDEMRRFSNFFTNTIFTKRSLDTVLALEVEVYASQRGMLKKKGRDINPYLFVGQNPSPLLGILRRNGYETTSIYEDGYLGDRKGPYIDNHVSFRKDTVCNKLDSSLRNISFWGYCHWFDGSFGRNAGKAGWGLWAQRSTVEEIVKASDRDGPQFVIASLNTPGHTGRSFRYSNAEQLEKFRKIYVDGSEEAAAFLESIIRHLEENDPEAILLIFGDHGPWLSRGLKFEDDPVFFVQDLFGTLGGVWPRDACAVELDEASDKGWMTTLGAVHALLRCLSGGESALIERRKGPFPKYGPIPRGVDLDYEDFLYE